MNLAPFPKYAFLDNNGRPLVGGLLFTYEAGTSNKIATYSDESGTPNTNPIVLDFRGEANVWLDQTLTYKFVLSPEGDTDPPTKPIWSVDDISAAVTFASLTQQIIGQILYPRTAAENSASVIPINYFYPEGIVDRYATNTTPGTTDMTQAIKNAYAVHVAGGAPVQFLGEIYLITDTCITITVLQVDVVIFGVPFRTRILNKAAASKPSISLLGASYWNITGLVFTGAATFPNLGIELKQDGSANRCAFGLMSDIVCCTNGGGIHIQDTNTIKITNYDYWPSGNGFGATGDANCQVYGILADGTSAVNGVYLENINIGGINTVANGGCGLKIDGSSSSAPFQAWTVANFECEIGPVTTHRALWARHVFNSIFNNLFTENIEVRFDQNCRYNDIVMQAASTGTLVFDGTGSACIGNSIRNSSGLSFTADAANTQTTQINNIWQVAPGDSDSSTSKVRLNTATTGGVSESDLINILWTTPTFSAGDYTSSSGSWTVGSGDVTTCEFFVLGKVMCFKLDLDTTTVAGGPSSLRRAIPGGFTAAKSGFFPIVATQDNGTTTLICVARLIAGTTNILFQRDLAGTAWSNVTDLNGIHCDLRFEIQ